MSTAEAIAADARLLLNNVSSPIFSEKK